MIHKLYHYRFESFLLSQLAILFGSLLMPLSYFDIMSPIFFFLNIITGSFFIGKKDRVPVWFIIGVLIIVGAILYLSVYNEPPFKFLRVGVLFSFYLLSTYRLIKQIWEAKVVDRKIILGLISGFISLGFVGFFIFFSIELITPGSFSGLPTIQDTTNSITERLMYFSYITLLTIGYGDMLPLTHLAQKATILVGLIGQIYLVVITAIVVGKYINQLPISKKE